MDGSGPSDLRWSNEPGSTKYGVVHNAILISNGYTGTMAERELDNSYSPGDRQDRAIRRLVVNSPCFGPRMASQGMLGFN